MSPPAEPLTGGRLIPPGVARYPGTGGGWPLTTDATIIHLAVPSTARYPVAAHRCLGLGIFYRGCHPRGPADEGKTPGPLRHDQWDMVFGLGFLGVAYPYCDSPASPQPLGDWKVGVEGIGDGGESHDLRVPPRLPAGTQSCPFPSQILDVDPADC